MLNLNDTEYWVAGITIGLWNLHPLLDADVLFQYLLSQTIIILKTSKTR
jgi:hypothetical protein